MALFRSKAEDKVRAAGYDPSRLPPGQYLTDKWPVLHAGSVPSTDLHTWNFRVWGEVEDAGDTDVGGVRRASEDRSRPGHPLRHALEPLRHALPRRPLARPRRARRPKPSARFAIAHAEQGFTANVPFASLEDDHALLATEANGEPLTAEHGWPLRLVIPGKYFWKSAKWLRGIELTASDRPGFWEGYGYHNDADPWEEERYGF